jgi:hypothetical protein
VELAVSESDQTTLTALERVAEERSSKTPDRRSLERRRPTACPMIRSIDWSHLRRPRAAAIQQAAPRRGLIVEFGGRGDAVVRLLPPLTIDPDTADLALELLTEAVAAA